MKMVKAVAYFRTSSATNVGEDKDSDKRQRKAVTTFAEAEGYEVIAEYHDAAVSGDDDLSIRPGFSDMLDHIESNGVRVVLIESADRLARKVLVQEVGIIALQDRGVTCLTSSGMELTDDSDEYKVAMRQVAAVFAQLEKSRLVRKLKSARDRKSQKLGCRVEGRTGYKADVYEDMRKQARKLHRRNPKTGKRRSLRSISSELQNLGYVTNKGNPFSAAQVKRIVTT